MSDEDEHYLNEEDFLDQSDNETIEQKSGLKRNTIDKFYTKSNIVQLCVEHIKEHLNINKNDLIIEPSAGNGSFISGIKNIV